VNSCPIVEDPSREMTGIRRQNALPCLEFTRLKPEPPLKPVDGKSISRDDRRRDYEARLTMS